MVLVSDGLGIIGSRVMPHFGQLRGLSETTSGCIGQVYSLGTFPGDAEGGAGAFDVPCDGTEDICTGRICTVGEDAGAIPMSVFGAGAVVAWIPCDERNFAGSALNFAWQPWQQK